MLLSARGALHSGCMPTLGSKMARVRCHMHSPHCIPPPLSILHGFAVWQGGGGAGQTPSPPPPAAMPQTNSSQHKRHATNHRLHA